MSDYDILPKSMPDTTGDMADRFDTALPEASFKDDYSQLAADIYELFLDDSDDITLQSSGRQVNNGTPPDENKKQQLRDVIEEALNKKLPQLILIILTISRIITPIMIALIKTRIIMPKFIIIIHILCLHTCMSSMISSAQLTNHMIRIKNINIPLLLNLMHNGVQLNL